MTSLTARVKQMRTAIGEFVSHIRQMAVMVAAAAPRQIGTYFTIQVIQGLTPALRLLLLKLLLDMVVGLAMGQPVASYEQFIAVIVGLMVITIFNTTLRASETLFEQEIERRMSLHVNKQIYSQFLRFHGLRYFESPEFHDTVRAAQNIHVSFVLWFLSALVTLTVQTASYLVLLVTLSVPLTLILFVTAIPMALVLLRYHDRRYRSFWTQSPQERKSWYLGSLLSSEHYAREIRLFNLGPYLLDQYVQGYENLQHVQRNLERQNWGIQTSLGLLQAVILSGAMLFVITQALLGLITLGSILLYIETIGVVQGNIRQLVDQVASAQERSRFFKHYRALMTLEPDIEVLEPHRSVPPLQTALELRGVSFRYTPDAPLVLDNVNLTLHKGECVALVGLNGAGKSTIVKLLSRFYDPTEGQILWDGIDIRHFDPIELRERMGAVFQDFVQYELTARENIGIGQIAEIENRDKIQRVARDMNVDKFIETLPQSYETVLSRWLLGEGEKGTDLSGGQWQKIAIARMNMREADVVMLDEPTAALDAEAEYEIFLNFARLVKDRTSILISHRFSTVRMADRIAVLQEGRITEQGTHDALMQHDGLYARLYRMQAEQYLTAS